MEGSDEEQDWEGSTESKAIGKGGGEKERDH